MLCFISTAVTFIYNNLCVYARGSHLWMDNIQQANIVF